MRSCSLDGAGASAKGGNAPALGLAGWLSLAAAPTFATMAALTYAGTAGPLAAFCAEMSPLTSMAPMYALMSVFHLAPWLKLASAARRPQASSSSPPSSQGS